MKIWIENPFDNLPVEGFRAQRYWLMAEAFARAGHTVTLWTGDFNHTTKQKRVIAPASSTYPFTLRLIPTLAYKKNISFRRILSHIAYALKWRCLGDKLLEIEKPDIIILSTPPICTGLVAARWKKRHGCKLVLDYMDLWPETFERVAPKWALWPLKYLARKVRNAADKLTSVAESYPGETFYHGIELKEKKSELEEDEGEKLKVVYVGNLGVTYDLKTVIEAVKRVPGATLEIAGNGAGLQTILAEKDPRIEYLGYLEKAAMEKLLSESDIGVVPMAPNSCVGIPYKFADYSAAGLAIVSSLGGESSALLDKYGAGASYRASDVESLIAALESLRGRLPAAKLGSRKLAETEFDSRLIYSRYVDFVSGVGTQIRPIESLDSSSRKTPCA